MCLEEYYCARTREGEMTDRREIVPVEANETQFVLQAVLSRKLNFSTNYSS